MTDQRHTTIVPRDLMRQMREQAPRYRDGGAGREEWLIERAAEWGYDQRGEVNEAQLQQARDQELEAIIDWMREMRYWGENGMAIPLLRAARRPPPPSLKRVALLQLDTLNADLGLEDKGIDLSQIRRALEALPND